MCKTDNIVKADSQTIKNDEVIFLTDGIIEWQGNTKEMLTSKHKMLKDYLNSKN